jgi:tRNA G18 (ribose-2'-O)-methylase SpoU
MDKTGWDIRLCENPECGLRYPLEVNNVRGKRCPVCLSATRMVFTYPARNKFQNDLTFNDPVSISVLLDNIRSALNVGAIFRTSEGFGVNHLYLGGITASPATADLGKTALGAEKSVDWSSHRNSVVLSERLAAEGYILWAFETRPEARPVSTISRYVDSARQSKGLVLVFGNEKAGVDPGILDYCQQTFKIPMHGKKSSYNVSVAFGIVLGLIRLMPAD